MPNSPHSTVVLTPALVMLMAFATGVAVASNYYAQPLLHSISSYFDLSYASAGMLVTVAQLCYALGLVLLVPLGDLLEQRRLIVGSIMSGLLMGILLARTAAGLLSELGSWRTIYWCAAGVMLLTTMMLYIKLPVRKQSAGLSYLQLLASIFRFFATEKIFLWRSIMGGLSFACFSVLWTPLAFLLSQPPYDYSDMLIGLFGLAGVAGALAANKAGKLVDQGKSSQTTTLGCVLLLLSWIPVYFGVHSVIALIVGIVLLDLCVQLVHVVNQNVIYQIKPEARNRLNAGYMLSYFIGGAFGSLASAWIYQQQGWAGVCVLGALLSGLLLVVWLLTQRRHNLPFQPTS